MDFFSSSPENTASQEGTLAALVRRHFSDGQPPAVRAGRVVETRRPAAGTCGTVLNSLDVDLPSGLERYMPTPIFRLRVMKKRLDDEIAEIETRLNKYRKMLSAAPSHDLREMHQQIARMEERLETLSVHRGQTMFELSRIIRYGMPASRLLGAWERCRASVVSGWHHLEAAVYGRLFGTERQQARALAESLKTVEAVATERMRHPMAGPEEVSELVNHYERTLRQSETLLKRSVGNSFMAPYAAAWQSMFQSVSKRAGRGQKLIK